MALGDGLEQGGLSDVCKADLKESQRAACFCERSSGGEGGSSRSGWFKCEGQGEQKLTIPLFKLLPGRPSRIFSCLTSFLGGIFFFRE